MILKVLDDFTMIQQEITDRKNCPCDSILKARLELWSLLCNQFCIILLTDRPRFAEKLQKTTQSALENILCLTDQMSQSESIAERTLLKIPFSWFWISYYQMSSEDCIDLLFRFKQWMTGRSNLPTSSIPVILCSWSSI